MSNNYFNFKIPDFNSQFGEDWDSFKTIVDDNVDHLINKIIALYTLRDITRGPVMAIEAMMKARRIEIVDTDTLAIKKFKLRNFNTKYKAKGLEEFYLDIAEAVVGTRGTIYSGASLGGWSWGDTGWYEGSGAPDADTMVWGAEDSVFEVYIDVDTTDSDELDTIKELYLDKTVRPAFYRIFLIDSSFTVLRIIE